MKIFFFFAFEKKLIANIKKRFSSFPFFRTKRCGFFLKKIISHYTLWKAFYFGYFMDENKFVLLLLK